MTSPTAPTPSRLDRAATATITAPAAQSAMSACGIQCCTVARLNDPVDGEAAGRAVAA